MAIAALAIMTAVRELLEGDIGSIRVVDAGDLHATASGDRRVLAQALDTWKGARFAVDIGPITEHRSTLSENAEHGIRNVEITITTWHRLKHPGHKAVTRDASVAAAVALGSTVRRAMCFPGNLTTTNAGLPTGILRGGITHISTSAPRLFAEEKAAEITHRFRCIVLEPPDELSTLAALFNWTHWYDAEHVMDLGGGTVSLTDRAGTDNAVSTGYGSGITPGTIGDRTAMVRAASFNGAEFSVSAAMPASFRLFTVARVEDTAEGTLFSWYGSGQSVWMENVTGAFGQLSVQTGSGQSGKTYAQIGDGTARVIEWRYNGTHATSVLVVNGVTVALSNFGAETGDPGALSGDGALAPMGNAAEGLEMAWGMTAMCTHGAMTNAQAVTVAARLAAYYGIA